MFFHRHKFAVHRHIVEEREISKALIKLTNQRLSLKRSEVIN